MVTHDLGIKRLNEDATFPTRAHVTDSGFDLYASEDMIILPGASEKVLTGIALQIPEGMEAEIRPRSGVTSKTKLRVQLGTIDNGYTGELAVSVDNIGTNSCERDVGYNYAVLNLQGEPTEQTIYNVNVDNVYNIRKGDRIAQLVVQYLPEIHAIEVGDIMKSSDRGDKGFGSSGTRGPEVSN